MTNAAVILVDVTEELYLEKYSVIQRYIHGG
jgi:hypothetical protein